MSSHTQDPDENEVKGGAAAEFGGLADYGTAPDPSSIPPVDPVNPEALKAAAEAEVARQAAVAEAEAAHRAYEEQWERYREAERARRAWEEANYPFGGAPERPLPPDPPEKFGGLADYGTVPDPSGIPPADPEAVTAAAAEAEAARQWNERPPWERPEEFGGIADYGIVTEPVLPPESEPAETQGEADTTYGGDDGGP